MDPWVCLALAVVNSPRTHFLRGANPAVVFRDTGQTDPLQYSAYGPQTGLGFFQLNSAYFKGVKVLYESEQKEKIYFTFGKYLRPDLPRVKCLFVLLFIFPFSILKS